TADSMSFNTAQPAAQIDAGAGTVTLEPYSPSIPIVVGPPNGTAALDLNKDGIPDIVAATLRIGHRPGRPAFGNITLTDNLIWSPRSNVELVTDGDIILSGGRVDAAGSVLLQSGPSPAAVRPTQAGTDVSASSVSFGGPLGPTDL